MAGIFEIIKMQLKTGKIREKSEPATIDPLRTRK